MAHTATQTWQRFNQLLVVFFSESCYSSLNTFTKARLSVFSSSMFPILNLLLVCFPPYEFPTFKMALELRVKENLLQAWPQVPSDVIQISSWSHSGDLKKLCCLLTKEVTLRQPGYNRGPQRSRADSWGEDTSGFPVTPVLGVREATLLRCLCFY